MHTLPSSHAYPRKGNGNLLFGNKIKCAFSLQGALRDVPQIGSSKFEFLPFVMETHTREAVALSCRTVPEAMLPEE